MDPSSPNPNEGAWWWPPIAWGPSLALVLPLAQASREGARPDRDVFARQGGLSFPLPRKKGVPLGAALRPGSHRAPGWLGAKRSKCPIEHRLTPFACPIRVIVQEIMHANES